MDANSQVVTTTVSFTIVPLNIPLATTFTLDGVCTDDGYATANTLVLKPYNNGDQANASIVRSDQYLWVCFTGLQQQGATTPGAFVGIRIDSNNSRMLWLRAMTTLFWSARTGMSTHCKAMTPNFATPGPGGAAGAGQRRRGPSGAPNFASTRRSSAGGIMRSG